MNSIGTRILRGHLSGIFFICIVLVSPIGSAQTAAYNPFRSFFISVDAGADLDLDSGDRSPENMQGEREEAYTVGAFLIGVSAGYRFNEHLALEAGWREAQHGAPKKWGNQARYTLGQLAVRWAFPLRSRQTPVLALGAVLGRFAYGSSSAGQPEDNDTIVAGPLASVTLEHELMLGLVGTLEIAYSPLFRRGMSGPLLLEDVTYETDGSKIVDRVDSKDFTENTVVHLLQVMIGFQFEWII